MPLCVALCVAPDLVHGALHGVALPEVVGSARHVAVEGEVRAALRLQLDRRTGGDVGGDDAAGRVPPAVGLVQDRVRPDQVQDRAEVRKVSDGAAIICSTSSP